MKLLEAFRPSTDSTPHALDQRMTGASLMTCGLGGMMLVSLFGLWKHAGAWSGRLVFIPVMALIAVMYTSAIVFAQQRIIREALSSIKKLQQEQGQS